jgi:hypothetical protein
LDAGAFEAPAPRAAANTGAAERIKSELESNGRMRDRGRIKEIPRRNAVSHLLSKKEAANPHFRFITAFLSGRTRAASGALYEDCPQEDLGYDVTTPALQRE